MRLGVHDTALIHALIGTRAQLIKMAPVLQVLERRSIPINLIFTGQHRITMQELLDDFEIQTRPRPLYDGPEVSGIGHMAIWFLECLWRLIRHRKHWFPKHEHAVVLVHGDTVSTLLGALAGRAAGICVAHVEAGLRSFRLLHPFPEELTRLAVFRLSDIAYCPGAWAAENLRDYGLARVDTGANTLLDSVRWALNRDSSGAPAPEPYFVASIHRFENLYSAQRLEHIVSILGQLTRHARCIFVLHPVTEQRLHTAGLRVKLENLPRFEFRPRLPYGAFMTLLAGARFVVTDGGSNQEELSYLGIPTVLMRAATERQEGLGDCVMVGNYDVQAIERFLDDRLGRSLDLRRLPALPSPSELIVSHLQSVLYPRPS